MFFFLISFCLDVDRRARIPKAIIPQEARKQEIYAWKPKAKDDTGACISNENVELPDDGRLPSFVSFTGGTSILLKPLLFGDVSLVA